MDVHLDTRHHRAVIFDVDGVVTDTASVHAVAWARLFDGYLAARPPATGEDRRPFTTEDYLRHVDGVPRSAGVERFLRSRGIVLPAGTPEDAARGDAAGDRAVGEHTVAALAARKDRFFREALERDGVRAFPDTVDLVRRLRAAEVAVAAFSASRNCERVLDAAGVLDLFPVRVDGVVAAELGLPGKPDPAMLLEATRRLGADPPVTVVVEDAESGVEAGRRGGFALVVGVERGQSGPGRLLAAGAHVEVADLGGVIVDGIGVEAT